MKKQNSLSENTTEQKFLLSRGLNASILRLCYQTRNSTSNKASYGIRITNLLKYFDTKKKTSIHMKFTLCSSEKNSFEIQKVAGQALNDFENYAEQIVSFLEKIAPVRIQQAVFDFIQDHKGKIWLINLKAITLTKTISRYDESSDICKKTLDEITCSVYCKLCGLSFKKDDASKVLTYKLLWELVQHLQKRKKKDQGAELPNQIKVSHSSTRPARVCNQCYMLVVSEHELIEVEQDFARAQNIPLLDSAFQRVQQEIKPKHRPALLNEELYQWRLLFYIQELTGLEQYKELDPRNLHLQYKIYNVRSCFKIHVNFPKETKDFNEYFNNPIKSTYTGSKLVPDSFFEDKLDGNNENTLKMYPSLQKQRGLMQEEQDKLKKIKDKKFFLSVNQIRVHYFFSEGLDLEKFLNETEIKLRITNGKDWNKFISEGTTKTIQHFKNKQESGQRHYSQILCFFPNAKYCKISVNVGLVCDGKFNTSNLNLYNYNNIFFPDENFFNAEPFPQEWIELFDDEYAKKIRDEIDEKMEYEKYSPKCTQNELSKMIDYEAHKRKGKFKNIESKIFQKSTTSEGQSQFQTKELPQFTSYLQRPQTTNLLGRGSQPISYQLDNLSATNISQKIRPQTAINNLKSVQEQNYNLEKLNQKNKYGFIQQTIQSQSTKQLLKPTSKLLKQTQKDAFQVILEPSSINQFQQEKELVKKYEEEVTLDMTDINRLEDKIQEQINEIHQIAQKSQNQDQIQNQGQNKEFIQDQKVFHYLNIKKKQNQKDQNMESTSVNTKDYQNFLSNFKSITQQQSQEILIKKQNQQLKNL